MDHGEVGGVEEAKAKKDQSVLVVHFQESNEWKLLGHFKFRLEVSVKSNI